MATSPRLRDASSAGGTPKALVTGAMFPFDVTKPNYGTADVRKSDVQTTVLTIHSFGAGDEFKLGVYALGDDGDFARTDTIAFTDGTDAAATDLQTALRTATGDTALTVSGTTDAGPYTITPSGKKGAPIIVAHSCTGGVSVQVSRGALAYDDVPNGGGTHPNTALNGIVYDQESSKGVGKDVPLGTSVESDGTGVTAGDELLPPTIDGAAGGSGEVVITATEVASGGTSAVVLYAIRKLDLPTAAVPSTKWVTLDSEDADGDVTISSLTAGDYVLIAFTQTALGRLSRPSDPTYFTVT